ncbi:hypothetical protein CMUS01_08815 [Colletotrichum musicola]|uniref:Uncharacterized protein n=1 Tax=Colletotrichum musicola TaxID=2175873 RepID=A0A8H6NC45_9PEZI|nr:hypothetical protein CMUS01_08815 [Colletotrichum musicola]
MEEGEDATMNSDLYQPPVPTTAVAQFQRRRHGVSNIIERVGGWLGEVRGWASSGKAVITGHEHHDADASPRPPEAEAVPPGSMSGPLSNVNSTQFDDVTAISPSTTTNTCEDIGPNRIWVDAAWGRKYLRPGPSGYFISLHPDHWIYIPDSLEKVSAPFRQAYSVYQILRPEIFSAKVCRGEDTALEIQIRMAGLRSERGPGYVLQPCLRIPCSEASTVRRVHKAVDRIKWCNGDEVPILVDAKDRTYLGAAAVGESGTSSPPSAGDEVPGAFRPFVRFRFSLPADVLSACGLTLGAILTEPGRTWAKASRIGGLLAVKSEVDGIVTERIVGVTTAHGLAELLDGWRRRNGCVMRSGIVGTSDDEDHDEHGSATSSEDKGHPQKARDSAEGSDGSSTTSSSPGESVEPAAAPDDASFMQVGCWIDVDPVFPMQFGKSVWHDLLDLVPGSGEPHRIATTTQENGSSSSAAADFALFSGEELLQLHNTYHREGERSRKAVHVETSDGDSTPSIGVVHLLLGPGKTASCRLLEGDFPLFVGSCIFNTRRVLLDEPLVQGVSGTWVVKEDSMVGVVLAISELEPTALIMPAEDVLKSIETASRSISGARVASSLDLEVARLRLWSETWTVRAPQGGRYCKPSRRLKMTEPAGGGPVIFTGHSSVVFAEVGAILNRLDEFTFCHTLWDPIAAASSYPPPVEPGEWDFAATCMASANIYDWSHIPNPPDTLISRPAFRSPIAGPSTSLHPVEPTETPLCAVVDVGSGSMENVRKTSAGNDVVRLGPAKQEDDYEQPEPIVFTREDGVSRPSVAANGGSGDGAAPPEEDKSTSSTRTSPKGESITFIWYPYLPPGLYSAAFKSFRRREINDILEHCAHFGL